MQYYLNKSVLDKYFFQETLFMSNAFHNFRVPFYDKISYQSAGGNEQQLQQLQWLDHGGIYTFNMLTTEYENGGLKLSIITDNEEECVTVLIPNFKNNAIVHNMSYYNNCANEGLRKPGGGDILFRFIINYLITNKQKYNIKKILLTDNSFLYCDKCQHNVNLANFRIITHMAPWYTKYGFKPYDTNTGLKHKLLMKSLIENNKVLDVLKITDYNILNIIKKKLKKII